MTPLELMVQSLKDSGYQESEERDEDFLGTKEFFVAPVGNQMILCLGPGHSGESGCKAKFYFIEGTLMGHACLYEEEE